MKLYAPGYYSAFKCLAEKCRNSCCIGWEIDVDEEALEKYKALPHIMSTVDMSDTPHFRLCESDRCPHLDELGLCKIIREYGEDYLSHICREHPRFYNFTARGKEIGLGLSCEEAARIVLSSDDYYPLLEIAETKEDISEEAPDNTALTDEIFSVLSDRSIAYPDRLLEIYKRAGVSQSVLSDDYIGEVLLSLEFIDESHKCWFSLYSSDVFDNGGYELVLERFLAYLIYRHVSDAEGELQLRSSFAFAFVAERLLASILRSSLIESSKSIEDIASLISTELEYSEENTDTVKLEFQI